MKPLHYFIIFFLFVLSRNAVAQFNMQAGFAGAWTEYESIRNILETYNPLVPESLRRKDFGDPRLDKALYMAARYQFEYVGIIGGFQFHINDIYNRQINPVNNQNDLAAMKLRQLSYFVGGELYVNRLALGTTVNFNDFSAKWQHVEDTKAVTLMDRNFIGYKFYFQWEMPYSDSHALIVQPFFHWTTTALNFRPVAEGVLPADMVSGSAGAYIDKPFSYGISLIFCNGEQRY